MRRLATALMVTWLLGPSPTAATSDDPSPLHVDPSGWVEAPLHGFAVRLAEAWAAEWVEGADIAESGLVLTTAEPEQVCLAQAASLDCVDVR